MFYLWRNKLGAGWELIESSEDEEYIRVREKECTTAVACNPIKGLGTAYIVTDYEFPIEEQLVKE